jgi:hypothetical protein
MYMYLHVFLNFLKIAVVALIIFEKVEMQLTNLYIISPRILL